MATSERWKLQYYLLSLYCVTYMAHWSFEQVDFEALARLTGVATQGRHDADQWVKSYKIAFSRDGSNYYYYKERGVVKVALMRVHCKMNGKWLKCSRFGLTPWSNWSSAILCFYLSHCTEAFYFHQCRWRVVQCTYIIGFLKYCAHVTRYLSDTKNKFLTKTARSEVLRLNGTPYDILWHLYKVDWILLCSYIRYAWTTALALFHFR